MTREEASNRLKQWIRNGCDGMTDERLGYIEGWFHKSDKEAFEQAIKALEQEPSGDLISREDRLVDLANAIESDDSGYWTNKRISSTLRNIKNLPPVTPKTGHWIYDRTRDWDGECKYECSECGMGSDVDYAYCMRCGAKMVVLQERSGE